MLNETIERLVEIIAQVPNKEDRNLLRNMLVMAIQKDTEYN